MPKTLLITGATDGLGKLTAHKLVAAGHRVLLHGRSADKLAAVADELDGDVATYRADLSDLDAVRRMAADVLAREPHLDTLINNAGVLRTAQPRTADGHDVRFVVNTLAPYLLTQQLLPLLGTTGRVINLSSAAQAAVDHRALRGELTLEPMAAYAQSKLAIAAWTGVLAEQYPEGPVFIALNPGSLLATKMVREGFGVSGSDPNVGADLMVRAALSPDFAARSGQYYDNDNRRFASLPPAATGTAARQLTQLIAEMTDVA